MLNVVQSQHPLEFSLEVGYLSEVGHRCLSELSFSDTRLSSMNCTVSLDVIIYHLLDIYTGSHLALSRHQRLTLLEQSLDLFSNVTGH